MKIIVFKNLQFDRIEGVASIEYYQGQKKTESDVFKSIAEYNMAHTDSQYIALDCSEEVYAAIRFILGEGKYIQSHSLNDIFFRLTSIRDSVQNLRELAESMQSDLISTMDDIDIKIQEMQKLRKGGKK